MKIFYFLSDYLLTTHATYYITSTHTTESAFISKLNMATPTLYMGQQVE